MALIKCLNCGSEISDKAVECPKCKTVLKKQVKKVCIECGNELEEETTICPKCGCPIEECNKDKRKVKRIL